MILSSLDYKEHPFYRVPVREAEFELPPFDGGAALAISPVAANKYVSKLNDKLFALREIMIKEVLGKRDLEALMYIVRGLLGYTSSWRPGAFSSETKAANLVEPLARQLLVVDAIFSACEAIGPVMNRQAWWGTLMKRIFKPVAFSESLSKHRADGRRPLVQEILAMLEIYRSGGGPNHRPWWSLNKKYFKSLAPTLYTGTPSGMHGGRTTKISGKGARNKGRPR